MAGEEWTGKVASTERQWPVGREEERVEWSSSERRVMGAVENYLENCADIKVDIESLARLIEPNEKWVFVEKDN